MTTNKIATLIPQLMRAVGAIPKDRKNQQQGYGFRSIDAVYAKLSPALSELGICVGSEVVSQKLEPLGKSGARAVIHMRYKLSADDGSCVVWEAIGEAADSYDKASNKAMSAAYKYAVFQGLSIPLELDDADTYTPDTSPPPPAEPNTSGGKDVNGRLTARSAEDEVMATYAARLAQSADDGERLDIYKEASEDSRVPQHRFRKLQEHLVTKYRIPADTLNNMLIEPDKQPEPSGF